MHLSLDLNSASVKYVRNVCIHEYPNFNRSSSAQFTNLFRCDNESHASWEDLSWNRHYFVLARHSSFSLLCALSFSWKIRNQFLAITFDSNHFRWARREQSEAHTWVRVARFCLFFQLGNCGNIFHSLFGGMGWFACFLWSGNFCQFSPLFQFAGAGVGVVSKWHAQEYKRALHLWSCFVVFPSILVCYDLKEAIELKGGTNNLQADKAREI